MKKQELTEGSLPPGSVVQALLQNRGLWYLASSLPFAAGGRLVRPPLLKLILYWCALSCGYVATGYLMSSSRLMFKCSSSGRIPCVLRILLFPFFLASRIFNWQARMRDTTAPFHEIEPGLFIGRRLLPSDEEALRKAGINAVLDVTVEYEALHLKILGEEVRYLNIPMFDNGVPSLAKLHEGVLWVAEQMDAGCKVMIHCALGRERSSTALLAYLSYRYPGRSLDRILRDVQQIRGAISPNARQLHTLRRYRASTLIQKPKAEVDLIINPSAGKKDHEEHLRTIRETLAPHLNLNIHEISRERSGEDLARESVARGVDMIIAAGGDGTVSRVASEVAGTDTALAIIPMGTANALATCLYGNLLFRNGAEHACQEILGGRTTRIDVARINERIMLQVAGIGFERKMVEAAEGERKERWGVLGYLLSGFEVLRDQPLLQVTLTVDGQTRRFETNSLVIANAAPFFSVLAQGGGSPRSHDGQLDITWIVSEDETPPGVFPMLELLRAGITDSKAGEGIAHMRGREILLETDPPTAVTVDGEVCMETPLRISVMPGALKVICSQDVELP